MAEVWVLAMGFVLACVLAAVFSGSWLAPATSLPVAIVTGLAVGRSWVGRVG